MIMKILYKALFLSGILLAFSTGIADEHNTETSPQSNAQNEQAPPAPATENNDESTNSFVPTESISEDLSVPFPVDI